MKASLLVLSLSLTLLGLAAVSPPSHAKDKLPRSLDKLVGGSLKDVLAGLELEDLEGESIRLSDYLGQGPVVFDFWATWCKPCLAAMPKLNELFEDLKDDGVLVIGINEDGPRNASKVKPFILSNDYTFPVLIDLNRQAQRKLSALALPTTILVDVEGKVVHTSFGYRPGEIAELRKKIQLLLKAKPDNDD